MGSSKGQVQGFSRGWGHQDAPQGPSRGGGTLGWTWDAPGHSETGTRGQGGGSSPKSSLMGSLFLSHFLPQFPSSCPSA